MKIIRGKDYAISVLKKGKEDKISCQRCIPASPVLALLIASAPLNTQPWKGRPDRVPYVRNLLY